MKESNVNVESTRPPITSATDWTGKDDLDDPRNYSLARKVFATAAYTFLAFVSTLAASIYSAGADNVEVEFHVTHEISVLPLSLFNLGLAFGPLIGSPLSETSGRKVVVLVTTPIFALFTLGSGFSNTIAALSICRFFAGVFAAPAIGNASATICDFTAGKYRSVVMSFYYAIPTFGALSGPFIGGFVVKAKGWRWTQWTTIFFIIAAYIPIWFTRETYKKTILQRRAKALNIPGPPEVQRTFPQTLHHFLTILFARPIHMLLTEPIVTLVCLYNGFLFGLIYTYVTASPWIYSHYYAFDLTGQSLSFLGLMIGTITSPIPLILLDHFIYQPRLSEFRKSNPDPEVRFPAENRLFPAAMIGAILLPIFLFLFAWTVRPGEIHWIFPLIFQSLAMHCSSVIYAPANLFMIDAYGPLYGASASGAAMLSRYTLSAAFPLFALQMYEAMGVGWATSTLGFCAAALAPVPWLFWKGGEGIRRRMRYETSS